jgi:hypothetical protein
MEPVRSYNLPANSIIYPVYLSLSSVILLLYYLLPSKASVISGFWILDLDLLGKSSGGITINYNTLNLSVITLC